MDLESFRTFLVENASQTMILIDGYDTGKLSSDVRDIFEGGMLKEANVIMTINPDLSNPYDLSPDCRMACMGFSQQSINKCFKNYLLQMKVNTESEQCITLFETLSDTSWKLRQHLNLPVACLMLFGYYQNTKHADIRDLSTLTSLFENYGLAMTLHYCKKQKIDVIGFEFPDEVVEAVNQLSTIAFNSLVDDKRSFSDEDMETLGENEVVFKLGAFQRFMPGSRLKFMSNLMQDFLAAKYMADFLMEDIIVLMKENSMSKKGKFAQTLTLLCGLYRNDFDTPVLKNVLTQLAVSNVKHTKVSAREVDTPGSEGRVRQPSGNIMDFNSSLQSLLEAKSREDACEIVAQSLPPKMVLKRDGLYPSKCLKGFIEILAFGGNHVTHLELHLHSFLAYQQSLLAEVGEAAAKSGKLKYLKINWSSLEIMAVVLNAVMKNVDSLDNVTLEDISKRPTYNVTASTWATLQEACEFMYKSNRFSFTNSKMAEITYFVLQHIPSTIKSLNFHNSAMNMMCAGELNLLLENATILEKLDLSNARLIGSEYVTVFQGLKICGTITQLRLSGAKLDRQGVEALAECLRLTTTLQVLDLSSSNLTTEMCQRLAEAIVENRSLKRLVMRQTRVSSEGRQAISNGNLEQVKVVGLEETSRALNVG